MLSYSNWLQATESHLTQRYNVSRKPDFPQRKCPPLNKWSVSCTVQMHCSYSRSRQVLWGRAAVTLRFRYIQHPTEHNRGQSQNPRTQDACIHRCSNTVKLCVFTETEMSFPIHTPHDKDSLCSVPACIWQLSFKHSEAAWTERSIKPPTAGRKLDTPNRTRTSLKPHIPLRHTHLSSHTSQDPYTVCLRTPRVAASSSDSSVHGTTLWNSLQEEIRWSVLFFKITP